MSLWWVQKGQLDAHQMRLIEQVGLQNNALVLGSPGSGKTNVLLRRAQFVRGQGMPNVLVLTFTRPLTEFVKTGCVDGQRREIFPRNCVTTLESWQRTLYGVHKADLPASTGATLVERKRQLSTGALGFIQRARMPRYDALFVDEAQDLLVEEVDLLLQWSPVLFLVGDDRQKIYNTEGLSAVRSRISTLQEHTLPFHYRMGPEICEAADRILIPQSGHSLASTQHYQGPRPTTITIANARLTKLAQLDRAAEKLKEQIRVYADLIRQGDRLGVIVARTADRQVVLDHLEQDSALKGRSKIIRSREEGENDYDPAIDEQAPICILTVSGCKGLEFRAVHWLFADELSHHHNAEHYYTVVTRAKTSLDISYTDNLPEILARAHADSGVIPW